MTSGGFQANANSFTGAISGNGRYVAFTSDATNLFFNDDNATTDVLVHDRQTGATTLISVGTGGTTAAGRSITPSISADGRYVAFASSAANLVAGDSNGVGDVFLRDRLSAVTTRVSVATGGGQGSGDSSTPAISGDGHIVAFSSAAPDLVAGDTNARRDAFAATSKRRRRHARASVVSARRATGTRSSIPPG